jgi:hypothetical protein
MQAEKIAFSRESSRNTTLLRGAALLEPCSASTDITLDAALEVVHLSRLERNRLESNH